MAFGVWRLAFGVWRLAFGVWRLAFGVWRLAFGVWRLAFGVWRLDVTQFRKFSRVFVTLGEDLSGEILLANFASRCLSAGSDVHPIWARRVH